MTLTIKMVLDETPGRYFIDADATLQAMLQSRGFESKGGSARLEWHRPR